MQRQIHEFKQTGRIPVDSLIKIGESVTTNGWKISVVESGDFGDVIKVEKTS